MKLNVLLAKVEHEAVSFKQMIKDYLQFFKKDQSAFKGVRNTYQAREGFVDDPKKRGVVRVATTVEEKLKWFVDTSADYINHLFNVEATNASGTARTELIVEGVSFGLVSTLELLRLRSLLDLDGFTEMYQNIPVRSDAEIWKETQDEMYQGRRVFENEITRGISRSETREEYILPDPNLQHLKDGSGYQPVKSVMTKPIEIGDYSVQFFSGEATHRERADILRRLSALRNAVIEALKIANEAQVVESVLTSDKIFRYLHNGPKAVS